MSLGVPYTHIKKKRKKNKTQQPIKTPNQCILHYSINLHSLLYCYLKIWQPRKPNLCILTHVHRKEEVQGPFIDKKKMDTRALVCFSLGS